MGIFLLGRLEHNGAEAVLKLFSILDSKDNLNNFSWEKDVKLTVIGSQRNSEPRYHFRSLPLFFLNIYGHYFCTRAFRCTMGSKLLWNRFQFSIYVSVNSWDSFLKTIYVEKIREIFSVYCKSWIFLRRPQKFDEINRFFD